MKAQEDIAGGQKREEVEEEGEDPYNEDNMEQVGPSARNQHWGVRLPLNPSAILL